MNLIADILSIIIPASDVIIFTILLKVENELLIDAGALQIL